MKGKTENELIRVKTKSLVMTEPFESLFSVDTETYKQTYSKVYVNMDLLGFDKTQPIIVWKGRNIVIDGHTRLRAAIKKEIKEVWAIEKEFLNEWDAIQYAVHLQRDRRKLTDADIFQLVRVLDKRHPEGRPPKTASSDAVSKPYQLNEESWTYYVFGMAGINDCQMDGKELSEYSKEIPYPNDCPKTALNLAIHKRIPPKNCKTNIVGFTLPGKGRGELNFDGDLLEGLSKFSGWAYGRSSDITATLIGTSSTKVEKCRYITDSENENVEDIKDKVLRGKLTINRACSMLKNNGKHGNGTSHELKFGNGIVLRTKKSINLDVKWIILGTHGKPPKINDPIPKTSIICPKE